MVSDIKVAVQCLHILADKKHANKCTVKATDQRVFCQALEDTGSDEVLPQ